MNISLKRAYDPSQPSDGYRIYIDALWPQGLSHATFHYDLWDKSIAPSAQLRKWFHANRQNRWEEFKQRYTTELLQNPAFAELKSIIAKHSRVTLLYSSKDTQHNNASILLSLLTNRT